jgi:hypothetical protein
MLPSRSLGNRPSRKRNALSVEITPGASVGSLQTSPILDGAKSALRTVGGGVTDLPLALADWFLDRADAAGRVWLWTGTFDPDRLRRGDRYAAPRDRVGHRAAVDALRAWHRTLTAYAPAADVLVGVEAHKSGARHAHAAVVTQPDFRFEWSAREWFDAHGYNVWERADRATAAARYAAKYVGKELGVWDAAFGGRGLAL